jgi:hypothetical protein
MAGKTEVSLSPRPRAQISVFVAQVSNLLFRRLPAGNLSVLATPADWKSAIQQVGNLRYDLCAPKYWDAHALAGSAQCSLTCWLPKLNLLA